MQQISVLVVSCDRYQDLWLPFFTLFFKYWPDCPYPVHLLANYETYNDSRVKTITVGEDRDWSSSFAQALNVITTDYILLLFEDYLLTDFAKTSKIEALAQYMQQKQAACLRLFPCPGPDMSSDHPEVGIIAKGAAYRLSTQAAIWRKQVLQDLLRIGESPWEFEIKGSRRTDTIDEPFLSVFMGTELSLPYFCTAVVKGKWVPGALKLCTREGIAVDRHARPTQTWREQLRATRFHRIYRNVVKSALALHQP